VIDLTLPSTQQKAVGRRGAPRSFRAPKWRLFAFSNHTPLWTATWLLISRPTLGSCVVWQTDNKNRGCARFLTHPTLTDQCLVRIRVNTTTGGDPHQQTADSQAGESDTRGIMSPAACIGTPLNPRMSFKQWLAKSITQGLRGGIVHMSCLNWVLNPGSHRVIINHRRFTSTSF
jgi:hypothetical protein